MPRRERGESPANGTLTSEQRRQTPKWMPPPGLRGFWPLPALRSRSDPPSHEMKLISILMTVIGELGIGTTLFLALQPTNQLRKSFFVFQSWLVTLCFLLMALTSVGDRFFASAYFPAGILSAMASYFFSSERFQWGKRILLISACLVAYLLISQIWAVESKIELRYLALVNMAAGTFLFGWVNGAMILGHWYLIMRGLSFVHFQRATTQLLMAVVVRAVGFGICYGWSLLSPSDPLFLSMRVLWGLILPAIFGFMAWRCARIKSNQAGTGLLYIAEVAVLIGEILAGYIGC